MQDLVRTEREPSTRDLARVWNWRKCSSPRQIMTRCHTTRLTCTQCYGHHTQLTLQLTGNKTGPNKKLQKIHCLAVTSPCSSE